MLKDILNGRTCDINGLITNAFYTMSYLVEIYLLYTKTAKFFMKEKPRYT